VVTHYALAHPEKQFLLKTPDQDLVNATPVGGLSERVYQLFGRQALEELVEIPATSLPVRALISEPELKPEEPTAELTVRGFVSRPEVQRPNRNGIFIFVHRRLVRDRLILHAIHEAYRNILPPNVFPTVLLFLELPYEEVDVNVHPSKVEVRFRHPQIVHDLARDSIRQALVRARPIASCPAANAAAAEQGGAGFAAEGASTSGTDPGAVRDFRLTGAPLGPEPERLAFAVGQSIDLAVGPEEFAERFREVAAQQLETPA